MKIKSILKFVTIMLSTLVIGELITTNSILMKKTYAVGWSGSRYIKADSTFAKGWLNYNGKTYYLGDDGYKKTGIVKINNEFYDFSLSGELIGKIDTTGNFEVKKEWFYGRYNKDTDTPYSVTIKVPKKLYYECMTSNNQKIQDLVQRKDDIQVFKNFINEVMQVADENDIADEDRVDFLITASLASGRYMSDEFSMAVLNVENDPTKFSSITRKCNSDGTDTIKANGKEFTYPRSIQKDYIKTPIESFVEGGGDCDCSAVYTSKICSVYGLDSLILSGKTHVGNYVTGCRFADQRGPKGYSGLVEYNGIKYGYASDFGAGTKHVGSGFTMNIQFCDVYPVPKL